MPHTRHAHGPETGERMIVLVLQDLVARQAFESYADLKDALAYRLAGLRIPYDAAAIASAVNRLEGERGCLLAAPDRPLSTRELTVAKTVMRKRHGVCHHTPPCHNPLACLNAIAYELRGVVTR